METYLIFFGKSRHFTLRAFRAKERVHNFNNVIKDFDLLESKYFTVDAPDCGDILAKYHFSKASTQYSLIKLYSHAQANDSLRIVGNIYGVALLSEFDLQLSSHNIAFLQDIKTEFARLCLTNLKFRMVDFSKEAEHIWSQIADQNGFNLLDLGDVPVDEGKGVMAFHVNSLENDPPEHDHKLTEYSRLYFSNDLEHLKRNLKEHPKFQFQHRVKGTYLLYQKTTTKAQRLAPPPASIALAPTTDQIEDEEIGLEDHSVHRGPKPSNSALRDIEIFRKLIHSSKRYEILVGSLLLNALVVLFAVGFGINKFLLPMADFATTTSETETTADTPEEPAQETRPAAVEESILIAEGSTYVLDTQHFLRELNGIQVQSKEDFMDELMAYLTKHSTTVQLQYTTPSELAKLRTAIVHQNQDQLGSIHEYPQKFKDDPKYKGGIPLSPDNPTWKAAITMGGPFSIMERKDQ